MLLTGIAISFFVTFSTLPIIIRLFRSINLLDAPDRRKVHKLSKPSLGGISIYAGVLIAVLFVTPLESLAEYKFFIAGIIISLLLGMRDDISSLYASQKIIFQVLAAFVTVYYAGISLTGFHGIFGIDQLPNWLALGVSVFVILSISNAFNLIDGIDGLAGSLALFGSIVLGTGFIQLGDTFFATLSFILAGSLVAFLIFNWNPAKIFMGDTGSLVTGFILATMAIRFIEEVSAQPTESVIFIHPIPVVVALLIVPIYDTLRVMSIRIFNGVSPFFPDRKHIHHILIRQGFSHAQATLILLAFTILVFSIATQLQNLGNHISIMILAGISVGFGLFWDMRLARIIKKEKEKTSSAHTLFVTKSA